MEIIKGIAGEAPEKAIANNISADTMLAILEQFPGSVFFKDTKCQYQFVSKGCDHIMSEVVGKTDLDIQKNEKYGRFYYEDDKKILLTGKGSSYVNEFPGPDGEPQYLKIVKEPVRDQSGNIIGIVGEITDVTVQVIHERKIEELSRLDLQTGLQNNNAYLSWIETAPKKNVYPMEIVVADCDLLKEINDSYGHRIGDQMISLTANLLKSLMPENATAYRVGGDEFVIIFTNASPGQSEDFIKKAKEYESSIQLQDFPFHVSYGCSKLEKPTDSFDIAFMEADMAMYEAKRTTELKHRVKRFRDKEKKEKYK